ncbi:DUF6778 family protein [Roseovarius sp. 2305UL8-3]|uniref:DUF6778 family protein n=1 Tax=Roseovarius conchicola TaxID=3121636 RepID=UPI003527BEC9
MKLIRILAAVALTASVSACATVETATRAAPLEAQAAQPTPVSLNVQGISVAVPQSLKVSEANLYYPSGDIVWREDPAGDRHAQVEAIFEAGLRKGLSGMTEGAVPVRVEVQVTRFHALTEKARYTVGGVHSVQFMMRLVNPETGIAYTEPRLIKADFKAYGGAKAIEAERAGITQKVRITDRIAEVIQQELLAPGSFKAANNGLIGAINQL